MPTSLEDKLQGKFERVDKIKQADEKPILGYLRGYDKPVYYIGKSLKTKMGV